MERLRRRDAALAALRAFFRGRGFLEVDTPMLVPGPGLEPHIDPLEVMVRTSLDGAPTKRWLHTSPELALKRVMAEGAERVFQVARVFRDGERTLRHLPEFTMVEWYRAREGLSALVEDVRLLLVDIASALEHEPPVDLDAPLVRASVAELFASHADVDLDAALAEMAAGDALALVRRVKDAGHHLRPGADFEDAFFHVMTTRVEPALDPSRPIVVERWPRQMAVLARLCDDDPRYANRFEIYAGGLELCNAFDELTDPDEQRARFCDDNRARRALGKPELPLDEDFLAALSHMPRTAGIALGFDRVLMLLLGASSIDEVCGLPWR